jgi:hypothetical protein
MPQAPRAAKLLTVDVGTDLKTRWLAWCSKHQQIPGRALKHLIETTLRAGETTHQPDDPTPHQNQTTLSQTPPPSPTTPPQIQVGTHPDPHTKPVTKTYTPPYATKERTTRTTSQPKVEARVSFTVSEHEALVACAAAEGFGVQEFVIASVRAALAQAPTYGQAELEALTRSNATLVNVVSALVALKGTAPDPNTAGHLQTLEQDVRSHIEHVSRTLAIGTRRWQLKI